MSGVFARKIANIDKHKWRIIASGGSRILDSSVTYDVIEINECFQDFMLSIKPPPPPSPVNLVIQFYSTGAKPCKVSIALFVHYRSFSLTWSVAPVGWWNNTKYLNKKELIPVPYTNMAAISLFWYTNMAAVTSDENDLFADFSHYSSTIRFTILVLSITGTWSTTMTERFANRLLGRVHVTVHPS
jgi:hypothetical protein